MSVKDELTGSGFVLDARTVATPVAAELFLCRESARSPTRSAHSAAGLCASAQLKPADRLFRSAEAPSRAAVAALGACMSAQSTSLGTADAPRSARRRRRRQKAGKECS